MRTTIITIAIACLVICAGIGCNNDKTELAWINDAGAPINDIVWANGDQKWSRYDSNPAINDNDGYSIGTRTESKKVDKLYGSVDATIWDGSGFAVGQAIIDIGGTPSSSLSLSEGSSEVYRITDVQ